MSTPGWYPDPAGASGRYRYWDGKTWSAHTRGDPRSIQETDGQLTSPPRRRTSWLIGAIVLIVALVAAGALIARSVRAIGMSEVSPPTSTVSGWDDSSPTASPHPSPSPSSTPTQPVPLVPCPSGDPRAASPHPHDGRVHGGNLSFAEVSTFRAAVVEKRFSFAHDVAQQTLVVDPDPKWLAQLAVGRLRGRDGFTHGARNTAESVAECSINANMYQPFGAHRADIRSEPVSLSGRPGWLIETNVTVETPGLSFPGDHVMFIVVADGADWGMFFGAVPMGSATLNRTMAATVADLRIS